MRLKTEVQLPDGVQAKKEVGELVISLEDKSLRRVLPRRKLNVKVTGTMIELSVKDKKDRALVGTFASHIRNMSAGLKEPFTYKLKACSTHFPMSVKLENDIITIQNFVGRKAPITVKMPAGVDVKVEKDIITLSSIDIELAGQAASRIEQSTRLNKKDRRIFMDGVFMTKKAKKDI
jgi:large subunit ribosomal protein L6